MGQVLTLDSFMNEMKEKGENGTSKYKLRNEDSQVKNRVARIPKLKKDLKKKSKLIVILELAVPFNPMTGVADDDYNPNNKFRPLKSATTVALMLKGSANANTDVKAAFMSRAGVEDWDTSALDTLTKEDIAIFKKYRVPRIFSFPVVKINIPAMTGEFGRDYTIDVEVDPQTGEIVGELPLVLQADRFFNAMAFEELKEFQEKIDKKLLVLTDKQQKDYKRDNIFSKNPLSDVHPSNWLMMSEIPLTNDYTVSADAEIATATKEAVAKSMVISKQNKSLGIAIGKYLSGEYQKFDKYFDYFELDMACPTEGATPAEVGLNTTYEKPTDSFGDTTGVEKYNAALVEHLDDSDKLEDIIVSSVRIPAYGDEVENQLCTALESVIDIDNKYLTQEVIKRNKDFINIALGEKGAGLLLDVDMGISDKEIGSADLAAAQKVAKEINIDIADIMNEGVDLEELNVGSDSMSLNELEDVATETVA